MRKPTDRFFKILTEAIAKRNPYGVDIESERETQGFIPIISQKPDYSYHGITKRENVFKGEVQKTLQEKGLAEKISDRLKIKSDIKKLEMKSEEPELFVGIKDLERAKLATLQKDLRETVSTRRSYQLARTPRNSPKPEGKLVTVEHYIDGRLVSISYNLPGIDEDLIQPAINSIRAQLLRNAKQPKVSFTMKTENSSLSVEIEKALKEDLETLKVLLNSYK